MKRLASSSTWAVTIILALCLAPSSFGQNVRSFKAGNVLTGPSLCASAVSGVLGLHSATAAVNLNLFDFDKKKKKKKGGGTAMPEGGHPFIYLALAGSACFGGLLLSHRRRNYAEPLARS